MFCPTDPHRAAQTRIKLNSQSAESPADQGEGDSGEPCRTDPDEPHPAENRKVGGSIPSLPTTSALVSGAVGPLPLINSSPIESSLRHLVTGRVRDAGSTVVPPLIRS
jgi:hypothetical protein